MIEKQPSCDDVSEPELLPVSEARSRLFRLLTPVTQTETIAIEAALGRVLGVDVVSPMNVPSHDNSAMDGYAINKASIPDSGEASLDLLGTAWAGQPYEGTVNTGEAVRIFTGGIMPSGTDTVVIQEHVAATIELVTIDSDVSSGRNVRLAGEDTEKGQTILAQGKLLEAAEIGVLASLGICSVEVFKKLKVAFFTTGDELVSLGTLASEHDASVQSLQHAELAPGMLYDSNRYTLSCLLARLGVEVIDMGIVRDNEHDTREALEQASQQADVIVSSGGVSAGDADFVTRVFHEFGDVHFWKLAMRPGRPLAFGKVGKAAFFGLPGNPVAVMVTFLQFVKPAVGVLSGRSENDVQPMTLPAISESVLRKSAGRVEYQRGVMRINESGVLVVASTGKQGAGRLSSMSRANCLIVIDADVEQVQTGDVVGVQPFHGLL